MDPNVTLKEMLALVVTILHDYEDEEGNGVDQDDACSLASHVDAMNTWMTQNGFSPEAWKSPPVFICIYTHKHGVDVAAYRTKAGAWKAAWQLADERVDESWDDEDKTKFKAIADPIEAINLFHDIEGNISYGESFEVHESPLGD